MPLLRSLALAFVIAVPCLWGSPLAGNWTLKRDDVPDATSGLSPQANGFDFDLEDALPPAFSTLTQIVALPTECAAHVGPDLECTSGMLAMSVVFEDCGDAFTVCRCDDAAMTVDTILDRFGRLPVGLRRYAGTVIVLNDGAPHAYTLATGETQYFGDCNLNTWIHETMHAYDFFPGESQSSSADWSAAIQSDSCVPDSYSLTNQVEDFAQMGVMTTYMLLHDGQLPPGFDPNCMSNQFNFMAALPLFNPQSLFGNTCAIQDAPLARHNMPPAVLDGSRTFRTVEGPAPTTPINAQPANGADAVVPSVAAVGLCLVLALFERWGAALW